MAADRDVILLVEDSADDVHLAMLAFEKSGVAADIVVARDGVEALAYLRDASRPRPRVVLLDLNLPRLDGFEVLRRVRADDHIRCVPVVILSSSTADTDRSEGYNAGANAYVRKPIDFEEFLEAVKRIALFWLELNEPAP